METAFSWNIPERLGEEDLQVAEVLTLENKIIASSVSRMKKNF
jgi:hypothetical protein